MNEMTRLVASPESFKARITTVQFLRMCAADVFDDDKIELVDGELNRMPPTGNAHGLLQSALLARLYSIFEFSRVRAEQGIDCGDDTVLGCDGVLLRQPIDRPGMIDPTDVLLVIEVAGSTLRRDRGIKRSKYAAAGVPLYWVVDGQHAVTHVHAEPMDGEYTNVRTVRFGEPLTVPDTDVTITLA